MTTGAIHTLTIDPDLLARHTGQDRVRTVQEARHNAHTASKAETTANRDLRTAWRRLMLATVRIPMSRLGVHPAIDAVIVGSAAAAGLAMTALFLLGAGPGSLLACLAVGYAAVGLPIYFLLRDDHATKAERVGYWSARRERHRNEIHRLKALSRQAAGLRVQWEQFTRSVEAAAVATLRRRQRLDEIDALLRVDCAYLSGTQFEQHLEEIFRLHGYTVSRIGQSGDQGVDLMVETNAGVRWAVQAKCYKGSVGNDAVQQAFTGMTFHGCQRCALITNSRTTRAAVEVAARVGCTIIDGQTLPRLIRGEIRL